MSFLNKEMSTKMNNQAYYRPPKLLHYSTVPEFFHKDAYFEFRWTSWLWSILKEIVTELKAKILQILIFKFDMASNFRVIFIPCLCNLEKFIQIRRHEGNYVRAPKNSRNDNSYVWEYLSRTDTFDTALGLDVY